MKKLNVINTTYLADKIIKKDNNLLLLNAQQEIDGEIVILGNLEFPNITNMNDYKLEEGQEWDVEVNEIEQIRLEQAQANAELFEMMLVLTGGGL